jgi:hypothetical protein
MEHGSNRPVQLQDQTVFRLHAVAIGLASWGGGDCCFCGTRTGFLKADILHHLPFQGLVQATAVAVGCCFEWAQVAMQAEPGLLPRAHPKY